MRWISIRLLPVLFALLLVAPLAAARSSDERALKIIHLTEGDAFEQFYPGALESLLEEVNERTALQFDPMPVRVSSFEDPRIFTAPFIYTNFGDRDSWELSEAEVSNLRDYLDRGGFLYVDAGVSAEFLREESGFAAQRHSYANWDPDPVLVELFRRVYPDKSFQPLSRTHPLFRAFYAGLPDPEILPENIRDFIVNEKWPQGTYSFLGMEVNGRLAVLTSPIIAMGWPQDEYGRWTNPIAFRVRETAEGLSEMLQSAAYSGVSYEVRREDGRMDVVYCQPATMPAWVREPDGTMRVFRYYNSREISDYAHSFYTRLGVNVLVFAVAQ